MCVRYSESRCVHFQIKSPFEKVVLHTTIIQVGRESLNFWRLSHHLVSLVYTHTHNPSADVTRWPLSPSFILLIHFYFRLQVQHPPAKFGVNSTHTRTDNVSEFDYICSHFMMPLDLTNKTSSLNQMNHLVQQQVQTCKTKKKPVVDLVVIITSSRLSLFFISRWADELGKRTKLKQVQ